MAFNPMYSGGSGSNDPWCTSCKSPITSEERSLRVDFAHDPHGHQGLTGLYHEKCGRPFASMARAMKMMSAGRF